MTYQHGREVIYFSTLLYRAGVAQSLDDAERYKGLLVIMTFNHSYVHWSRYLNCDVPHPRSLIQILHGTIEITNEPV